MVLYGLVCDVTLSMCGVYSTTATCVPGHFMRLVLKDVFHVFHPTIVIHLQSIVFS